MRKIGMGLVVIGLAIAWLLLAASPVLATNWELAAQMDQGLVRQYFDRDSIHREGTEVIVNSYYIDQRSTTQRIDYVTAYDCAANQFKDVEVDGKPTDSDWQPLVADPLNEATRDILCPA